MTKNDNNNEVMRVNNSVVIKSNKHGITVVLDNRADFTTLKSCVEDKFRQSAAFFGNVDMALAFEGRPVTNEEQKELLDIIEKETSMNILCVMDNDENKDAAFVRAVHGSCIQEQTQTASDGLFYKGTLRSGQVLESETSIIVLGDVNPGGRIISKGNVIVLGSLRGNVFAGANGDEHAFVVALEMNPMQIKIGDVIARSSDSAPTKKNKNKTVSPKISFVEDGNIYIEDLTSDILEDIRI